MISKMMTGGTSRQEINIRVTGKVSVEGGNSGQEINTRVEGKVPVEGRNTGQDINSRVGEGVATTGQPSEDEIDFIVEKTPPGCALVFGEKKKQLVTSLCKKFAIEACKKIDT